MEPEGTAGLTRGEPARPSSVVGSSTPFPTVKKRKVRHTRSKLGCQSCRTRRVKCGLGAIISPGIQLPCEKCAEVDEPCYYPHPDVTGRTTTRWVLSAQLDEHGRIVPRAPGEPREKIIKKEASASTSASEPVERLALKQGYNPPPGSRPTFAPNQQFVSSPHYDRNSHLAAPPPHHQEVKLEPLPLEQYYANTPLHPYFAAPTLPFPQSAPPSQIAFTESALRSQSSEVPRRQSSLNTYPPIPYNHVDPGITLPRIPKGIGTPSDHWQGGLNRQAPSGGHPWTFAQPPYPEAMTGSTRAPFARFPSTIAADGLELVHHTQTWPSTSSEFKLQPARMPWIKRTPAHIDYTKSRNDNKSGQRPDDKDVAAALHQYLNKANHPIRPPRTFSLASLTDSPLKRDAMSYFETRGCAEIIAINEMDSNWIYTQLFPRVYDLLSDSTLTLYGQSTSTRSSQSSQGTISGQLASNDGVRLSARRTTREFVHHSLIRLSCVHRVNTERDPGRIQDLRREIVRHGKRAMMAGLQVRVQCPATWGRCEEYLMGAFIGYMADMLDSQVIRIDPEILVPNQEHTPSPFEKTLREMLAVYVTLMTAFRPHDPLSINEHLTYELSSPNWAAPEHPSFMPDGKTLWPKFPPVDWVEAFFGMTRHTILQIRLVNSLVSQRAELLRIGQDSGEPGQKLRQTAMTLAKELGSDDYTGSGRFPLDRIDSAMGKTGRIRRGTNVTRLALLVIVLCELLEVDLEDDRLARIRDNTLEMVADSEASETAGFSWALTVVAVYTNPSARPVLTALLRTTQETSFGANYVHSTLEILSLCWQVLFTDGSYRNGIAPWREAMAVVGRSMYL